MKARLALLMLLTLIFCALGTQLWATPSATMLWKSQVAVATGANCRGLAVDQATGAVYVHCFSNKIAKFDADGTLRAIIGPIVKNPDGTTGFTIAANQPAGLAVDPLTGYLYAACGGSTARVIDARNADDLAVPAVGAVYVRATAGTNSGYQLNFSPDGLMLASVASGKARTQARQDNGTPTDPFDDTFSATGTIDRTATPPLLGNPAPADARGVAVDSAGNVYMCSNGNSPMRMWKPGSLTQADLEFKPPTNQWQCATDDQNNLWIGDMTTSQTDPNHFVHCYRDGVDIFKFDVWLDSTGYPMDGCSYPSNIAFDAVRGRVIIAGQNATTGSTATYVQCYQISGLSTATPAATITGRVVDADGNPVTGSIMVGTRNTYLDQPFGAATNVLARLISTADGTFSMAGPSGKISVTASATGNFITRKTHYVSSAGGATNVGDISILPLTSTFVDCTLGAHNMERGLFSSNAENAGVPAPVMEPNNRVNAAASIGGRDCRVIGQDITQGWLAFDLQDNNPTNNNTPSILLGNAASVGTSAWVEAEIWNAGQDRMVMQADTWPTALPGGPAAVRAPVNGLGWQPKTDTEEWITRKWYRPDFYFANALNFTYNNGSANSSPLVGDFQFGAMVWDDGGPLGADYISKVTVRKAPAADDASYMAFDKIADVKKFIYGQHYFTAYRSGGFAVKLTGKTVTNRRQLVNGDMSLGKWCVTIEDADRSAGIRVLCAADPNIPDFTKAVDVIGSVMVDPFTLDLVIDNATITRHEDQTAPVIKPVELANLRGVSGGGVFYDNSVGGQTYMPRIQWGTADGVGISSLGMLVRVCGKVTSCGLDLITFTDYAYIDDGSGLKGEGTEKGVKVLFMSATPSAPIAVGQTLSVTGTAMLGLYDPTPENRGTGLTEGRDEWMYTVIDAVAVN